MALLQKMVARSFTYSLRISGAIFHSVLVDPNPIRVSNSTISSSSSSLELDCDLEQLDPLNHKDWLSPNEVLKIFRSLRDPDSVISVLERISQRKDYKPNESLYTIVIQKLAKAKRFDSIEDVLKRIKNEKNCRLSDDFFNCLIKIQGNVAGHIDRAIETLFAMPEFGCWPTNKTFCLVLNMLVSAKQFDIVHEVYLGAPRLGVAIDACCLNILIKGLCECDNLDAAFALLDEFPKQGCRPNVRTYSTLMHCLCENGRVDEAFELCEKMERKGCNPDTITFNILISGLRKQGRVAEGMELLDRMMLKGCYPNSASYQEVLYGLLSSEKFVEAKNFMDRMISEGVFPSFLSYKLVIHGLCNENLLGDVDLVLKQMVHQGFVPKMGMWKQILERMFSGNNR
ncbi:hypothetical protein HHK36_004978 [Tetracentron sinense]|uniref:Pentatricopeptide repeat-containing protein n=1 Tax=Tetracentron sinense TaxID=13715 RepID=A0A834ZPK4_TETSI|nr:hypothetical protein HHK36_004978 [Tetracentron sinense]